MDAEFHQSQQLRKTQLQSLMQRQNAPAAKRFLIQYSLVCLTGTASVWTWSIAHWALLPSLLLFAIFSMGLFAALHETAHHTAFKSKYYNQFAAFWAGVAQLYPSTIFRELHFMHHRHTHVPGLDPEISLGTKPAPSPAHNRLLYIFWLTGLPLLLFKLGMLFFGVLAMPEPIRKRIYPFVHPQKRWWIALESITVLLLQSAIHYAAYVAGGLWALVLGQMLSHALLSAYLFPEHNGLPHEGDILHKTRSLESHPWLKWLMWNMPYHAEHHAYPAVPYHALPQLNQLLAQELKHTEAHAQVHWQTIKGEYQA